VTLSPSSLSQFCRSFADYLKSQLSVTDRIWIPIGPPADVAPQEGGSLRINLFFFRFEPSGFFPDTLPGETWFLRMHCLVTPFAAMEENISAGENELRLLGDVMRVFHETPLFTIAVEGQDFLAQVIFEPLGLEQINQLWSTQGETPYRASIAYELSLAPVLPDHKDSGSPLTGGIGISVRPGLHATSFDRVVLSPLPRATLVDFSAEDWAPQVAFVYAGACAQALHFQVGDAALAAFTPAVWTAGKPGEHVSLCWETWESAQGWQAAAGTPPDVVLTDPALDPERVGSATTTSIALPFKDRPGQMVLFGQRSYIRAADGVTLRVRSNPLLVTLSGTP
jgi:hypothetical protein